MSGSDDPSSQVPLTASARDLTTEIFVIDGRFNRIASGLGRVQTDVAPGMYKIKFKAGTLVREVRQAVWPGQPVHVEAPAMEFDSPVPIEGTRTSRPHHQSNAARISLVVHDRLGFGGSQLFLFVRDLTKGVTGDPAY